MANKKHHITEPLKLFLASSFELKPERDKAEIVVGRLNRTWPLENKPQIDMALWETFSETMHPERTQNLYNESITDCDLFVLLLWTKVGQFTSEEFQIAVRLFKHLERPRILVLQKNSSNTEESLDIFLEQFKQEGSEYFFRQFNDLSELELILTTEINHIYRWKYAVNLNPALEFRKALLPGLLNRYRNRISKRMEEEIAFKLDLQLRYTNDDSVKIFLSHDVDPNIVSVNVKTLTDLVILFNHNVKRLLITGDPGSGKTVMLLGLAQELTQRAIFNPYFPLPVLLNLDTWHTEYKSFEQWLESNLVSAAAEYSISKKLAEKFVRDNNMILLLDGFDEIADEHRDSFLVALKRYLIKLENTQPQRRYPQFVLTSRRIEYLQTSEDAYVSGVMDILPLKFEQIKEYLNAKIVDNQSAKLLLRKFEHSPLLIHKINTAFLLHLSLNMVHDFDFSNFDEWKLIEQYVYRELQSQSFTDIETEKKYLKFLAIKLYGQRSGMRFELADLQPDWLAKPFVFRIIYYAYFVLISSIGALFIAIAIILMVDDIHTTEVTGFIMKMFLIGGYWGSIYWISSLLFKNQIPRSEIHFFSLKNWDLSSFRKPFFNSYKKGMVLGTLLPLGMIFVQTQQFDFMTYFYFGFGCLTVGQAGGLCSGVISGLIGGFFKAQPLPKKVRYYDVLMASIRFDITRLFVKFYAIYFFVYMLIIAYNSDYSIATNFNTFTKISYVLFVVGVLSIISAFVELLINSSLIKHFILRTLLFLQGHLPFRLVKFLNAMSSTGLIERDGSKWRFRHLLFQEYFATENNPLETN